MTTSIPDSFNMDELSEMLETAPNEEMLHATVGCNDDKELTPEYIESVAEKALDMAAQECPDPLVHKVMAMMVIHRMIEWHRSIAMKQLEEGNEASMGCWMRDAGKFQAVMDILTNISVGPDDFTLGE